MVSILWFFGIYSNYFTVIGEMTIHAKLLTYREEYGGYYVYVFEDLDCLYPAQRYKITVRFPNWDCPVINIGDRGYLNYKEVVAGKDTWWDKNTQMNRFYNYTNSIFENFIHEKPEEKEINL